MVNTSTGEIVGTGRAWTRIGAVRKGERKTLRHGYLLAGTVLA